MSNVTIINKLSDNLAIELLTFIAKNMETESIFLTPRPITTIKVGLLLDKIAKMRDICCEDNGQEFNAIADSLNI